LPATRRWDIVVSDNLMPHNGKALYTELRYSAVVRFILSSGFGDGIRKNRPRGGMNAFLLKPVSAEQLAACIRRVLDDVPGEMASWRPALLSHSLIGA